MSLRPLAAEPTFDAEAAAAGSSFLSSETGIAVAVGGEAMLSPVNESAG